MGAPLTKIARRVKGDGRYPEYPAVGVDDDVGVLVVLVRDRVERPDVALPHSLRGNQGATISRKNCRKVGLLFLIPGGRCARSPRRRTETSPTLVGRRSIPRKIVIRH